MGKRRNRPRGAIRPTSYTGSSGQTFTADQVTAMLAAAQRGGSTPVAKAFGNAVPPAIVASEAQQQMTPSSAFSPGEPVSPYDGYSRQPRTRDFPAGYNIATRPRLHERVSFDTLKGLIDSYDVAQACIWHRIDTLRSVKLRLVPAEGYSGDVSGAIDIANGVLRKPDGRHYFKNWLAKWLYDVLAYDAGALYRLRNRGGRCVGLAPVSGPTIAPLLDWWGNEPLAPAPAYVQYGQGVVFNWLTRDDLIYEPMRPVNDSIYGRAPIEAVIMNANTDIRTQIHFLQRYTEGNIPEAFASAPETWSPDQIEQWQNLWDSIMYGDQSRKSQIRWMPGGSTIVWSNEKDFTDSFSLFMMRKTCLDEETEILTRRGWAKFPKLTSGDEVATRSPDGQFEWQQPTDYIAKPHAGEMVSFKSNSLDLLVTPDHRMLLTYFPTSKHPRPKEFIRTAGEIIGKRGYMIPMRSHWEGRSPENFVLPGVSYDVPDRGGKTFHTVTRPDVVIPMRTWLAFLGLWLAEGHTGGSKGGKRQQGTGRGLTYKVGITQSDSSPYCAEIQELLDSLPFTWHRGDHAWIAQDMRLHAYLAPLGNSYSKYIPEDVKDLSPELLEILWAWACKGDGHHYLGKFWQMITASEQLAGDWQEVLQKCGRDGSVSWRKGANGGIIRGMEVTGSTGTWIVRERTSPLRSANGEITSYEGMVYCVTVPNGVIYVRRNGRPAWVGNCASFHVVPVDLGFTESSNYSTGESQADVAHKVGELPLMEYTEEILSQFLYDDLQLPLKAEWDRGEDQDDRATQAQADQTYIQSAVVSADEIREMRFGLPIDSTQPVPRIFFSERGGPIPLNAVLGVAGPNDPETASPSPGAPLPKMVFPGTPAVMDATVLQPPLAESEYGLSALPPAPPMQPMPPGQAPVGKEAAAGDSGSPGITAETGLYGDPLIRDDDEDDDDRKQVAKSELAAFRRYTRSRRKAGEWRDFRFTAVGKVAAHNLNDSGRLAVRKDAGQIAVAGLAVLAADTGRVLMLQRALEDDDPAAGKLEFPGGHLEGSESPLAAAWREWCEETGCIPPPGVQAGSWVASNGIYQGIVWTVDSELMVPVRGSNVVPNPDMDPDGDGCEAILFMDPADLPGNPAVRPELLADIDAVMAALGCSLPVDSEPAEPGDCCGAECCADGCCNGTSGCTCGTDVAKAASPPPKWPGWELDLPAAGYWGQQITAALSTALSEAQAIQLANAYLAAHPGPPQQGQKREAVAAAALWLSSQAVNLAPALAPLMPGILADGYLIGAVSATTMTDGTKPDTGGWKPGNTQAAQDRADALGLGSGLAGVLDVAPGAVNSAADGYMTALGRALVDAAAAGLTAKAASAALLGVLSDAAHATATALGQIVTAIGQAATAWYRKRHVEWVAWFTDPTSNVCPICLGNEAQGPVPFGTPFESGDTGAPAHRRCRCCTAPVPAPEG